MADSGIIANDLFQTARVEMVEDVGYALSYAGSTRWDWIFPANTLADLIATLTSSKAAARTSVTSGTHFKIVRSSINRYSSIEWAGIQAVGALFTYEDRSVDSLLDVLQRLQAAWSTTHEIDLDASEQAFESFRQMVDRTTPDLVQKVVGSSEMSARFSGIRDHEVSAAEFGVRGDGSDETAAMQSFLNYICTNGAHGVIPFRDVRISSSLVIPNVRGWTLRGMGRYRGTNLICISGNIPIIRMGAGGATNFRDWVLEDICLTYADPQSATSTSANCLYFEAMPYQFEMHNVYFRNGYYGIAYAAGVGGAWGGDWDGILFGSMSGGWINMAGTINSVPNNRFGRIYGDASTCTDYLFKSFTGYNSTIATVEVINLANAVGVVGSGIFDFTVGSSFIIGAVKVEGGRITAANADLVRIPAGCFIQMGEFRLQASNGGLTVTPSSGDCCIFALNSGGTAVSTLDVGLLAVTATATGFVNGYVLRGGQRFSQVIIKRLEKSLWKISNRASGSVINENIRIDQWMNARLSVNKGDAGVVVVPGETEGTLFFETALTAQRDIALPSDSSELIGGLRYRVYVGANVVNGTNYLRITVPGIRVIYTKQTTNAEIITVEWRTNASGAAGWVVTGVSPVG